MCKTNKKVTSMTTKKLENNCLRGGKGVGFFSLFFERAIFLPLTNATKPASSLLRHTVLLVLLEVSLVNALTRKTSDARDKSNGFERTADVQII